MESFAKLRRRHLVKRESISAIARDLNLSRNTVKLAHFRLCYSRQMFLVAYLRETQEMLLDTHNRAFAFFGGVPERMVYDNPKTIVQTVLVGKAREFHPRFLALANHYLFESVACTQGWGEAGFRKSCFALPQPVEKARTIAQMLAEEQPRLGVITAPFDGYFDQPCRVSSTCLVAYDRNRYSAPAEFAGQQVSLRAWADRIGVVANGRVVAEHPRCFSRERLLLDPWHYLPVQEKKPGALRHAPLPEQVFTRAPCGSEGPAHADTPGGSGLCGDSTSPAGAWHGTGQCGL